MAAHTKREIRLLGGLLLLSVVLIPVVWPKNSQQKNFKSEISHIQSMKDINEVIFFKDNTFPFSPVSANEEKSFEECVENNGHIGDICDNYLNNTPVRILSLSRGADGKAATVFVTNDDLKNSVFSINVAPFVDIIKSHLSGGPDEVNTQDDDSNNPLDETSEKIRTLHDEALHKRALFEESR